MHPAIELKDINKTFVERSWRSLVFQKKPKKVEALKDVTLTIGQGEVYGLLGPNGAGKTTLIKILATLIIPDSGSGSICGYDLEKHSHDIRRFVGLVNSAERSFYWRLTGRQNLNFFASLYNLDAAHKKNRISELLELVDLIEKADVRFMKYSEGQKQRLAVARALLHDPEVILMDEATKSLDPIGASELKELAVKELAGRRKKTILWCTHNLKEAEEVCGSLAIIHKGSIIARGSFRSLQALFEQENSYCIKVENCSPGQLAEIDIVPSNIIQNNGCLEFELRAQENEIPLYIKRLVSNGIHVHACTNRAFDLEEIFERLIKNEHATANSQTNLIH